MKLIAMLTLVVANDIAALLPNQRICAVRRDSRFQFVVHEGQVSYDPFESDAKMQAMMVIELSSVKLMNTTNIKLELSTLGYNSKGFVDKFELEKFLARKRVTGKLQRQQEIYEVEKVKSKRVERIEDEVRRIEASKMTELSIINELHSLKMKFDVSEDLTQQLALARLGIPTPASVRENLQNGNNGQDSGVIADTVAELKDVYTRFVQNIEGVLPNTTVSIDSILNQDAVGATLKSVQEYAKNIGLTKIEQEAQILTSEKNESENENRFVSRDPISEMRILNDSEIINAMKFANSMESFDEIVLWAKNKSRSELSQLLEYRRESIPKYATRSALAAILADSILVYKTNEKNDHSQNNFGRNFIANSNTNRVEDDIPLGKIVPWVIEDINDLESFESGREISYEKNFRKSNDKKSNRKRLSNSREMSSFFFEKELFQKFSNVFSNSIKEIISQDVLDEIKNGETQKSFTSFVSRIINFCCKGTISAAIWAGGKSFSASHVIFVATAYSLITKKGLWSFLGTFFVVRIFREMAFVRDAFTDQSVPTVAK